MSEFRSYKTTIVVSNSEEAKKLAKMVEKIIKGKSYTWVESYEYMGWRPTIRTNQKIDKFIYHDNGFSVCDTYGIWGVSANEYHPSVVDVYENGIQVDLTTPAGKKAWWQIYVEK